MHDGDFEGTGPHGRFIMIRPVSDAARSWVEDHIPEDAPMLAGRIAVELRSAALILEGIEADGMTTA